MWTAYFDEFFALKTAASSRHIDFVISGLFSILGWKLSSEKLLDYHAVCKVLGVELDMSMARIGQAIVKKNW